MKKSYYYEPIVTPIANNGSSKFGYKAKTVSFNDSLNTRFEVEIAGKTIEELKQKTDDFFKDSIQLKCEYYLCSKSVVELFKPFEVSKPFKSGYADDNDDYFVAWLNFEEVDRYYQANEEKILNSDDEFYCRECVPGTMDVSNKEIIFRGFLNDGTEVYQDANGNIFDASNSKLIFTEAFDFYIKPLSGKETQKAFKVVLTIAHLDHDEENHNVTDDRLKSMCQRCHLRYDAKEKSNRKKKQTNQTDLFL